MIAYIDAKTTIDLTGTKVTMTVEFDLDDAIASYYSSREEDDQTEKWVIRIKPNPSVILGQPVEFELVT